MFHYLQLYQWFMLLLSTSNLSLVLALPPASYSFIHLDSCPICEAQYDYDFTVAVQLALDNLEWSNGSTLLGVNGSRTEGEGSRDIMEPGTVLPAIQAIPLQVGLNFRLVYSTSLNSLFHKTSHGQDCLYINVLIMIPPPPNFAIW